MLAFLKRIFLGDEDYLMADHAAAVAERTRTTVDDGIRYDAGLVARFKAHHRHLVDEILGVKAAMEAKNYPAVTKGLRTFRAALQQHLLEENVMLYTYLSFQLADDAQGRELLAEMRYGIREIERQVSRFIQHYLDFGISDANALRFRGELGGIMSALGNRICREESALYALYLPPGTISNR